MLRPNAFLPRPEERFPTRGVQTHPGFHTAGSVEIAAPYAQARFETGVEYVREKDAHVYTDFPVIIKLDMQGLEALTDYDAENVVRRHIVDVIKWEKVSTVEDLQSIVEHAESEGREAYETALSALFYLHPTMENPMYALLDYLEELDPDEADAILVSIQQGNVPPALLQEVTQQYRYLDVVDSARILEVMYMQPFWSDTLDWEMEDNEKEIARVEAYGFDVASPHEEPTVHVKVVWSRPTPAGARVEYHGTSYQRLLLAAPELAHVLPIPPAPFETLVPDAEDADE